MEIGKLVKITLEIDAELKEQRVKITQCGSHYRDK